MTSMYTELLLDITDVNGDKINGVNTLPVVLGKQNTIGIVTGIVLFNWINTIVTNYLPEIQKIENMLKLDNKLNSHNGYSSKFKISLLIWLSK